MAVSVSYIIPSLNVNVNLYVPINYLPETFSFLYFNLQIRIIIVNGTYLYFVFKNCAIAALLHNGRIKEREIPLK